MFIYGTDKVLYVYDTLEHMQLALQNKTPHYLMVCANYALEISDDAKICKVLKDRSGVFDKNIFHSTKQILRILQFLSEKSE